MNVRVVGPNLNDQTKGSFHVHADGCADLKKYGPGRRNGGEMRGEQEMLVENATTMAVVEAVYGDFEDYDGGETYVNDFWFAPCCADALEYSADGTTPEVEIARVVRGQLGGGDWGWDVVAADDTNLAHFGTETEANAFAEGYVAASLKLAGDLERLHAAGWRVADDGDPYPVS